MLDPVTLSPLHQVLLVLIAAALVGKAYLMGHISGKLSVHRPNGARVCEVSDEDPRRDVPSAENESIPSSVEPDEPPSAPEGGYIMAPTGNAPDRGPGTGRDDDPRENVPSADTQSIPSSVDPDEPTYGEWSPKDGAGYIPDEEQR